MMSLLPNESCFSKYCWSLYEQKSIVNSFCADDWTAEWAISVSSRLRYQYPNYTFPCDNCNLTKGICSEKGIVVKAVFFPYGCQDFYIFSALNTFAGISWLTDANIYILTFPLSNIIQTNRRQTRMINYGAVKIPLQSEAQIFEVNDGLASA